MIARRDGFGIPALCSNREYVRMHAIELLVESARKKQACVYVVDDGRWSCQSQPRVQSKCAGWRLVSSSASWAVNSNGET